MSGDRVLLLCPIQPGALLQYYSVTWRKDNISIIDLMNLQIVRRTDSRYGIKASIFALIIQPASVQDSSKHYQCVVYVSNPLSNSQTELQLSPQRDVPLSLSVVPDSDTIESMFNILTNSAWVAFTRAIYFSLFCGCLLS